MFSTAADNQTSTEIHITQGERPMAADNKSLGKFVLDGIPPAPRGVPQIEVAFDVDSNGVLNVTAKDKSTGTEQSIRIEANSGLSEDDIERMKKEAEEHAGEDAKKKELIEKRNTAEQMIYTAEKSLKDHGEEISADIKADVEEKLQTLRECKDGDNGEAISSATEALGTSLQKIGEAMQQKTESATQQSDATDTEDAVVHEAETADNEQTPDSKEDDSK